jgi:hypothetical protein
MIRDGPTKLLRTSRSTMCASANSRGQKDCQPMPGELAMTVVDAILFSGKHDLGV